jgi:hypothetical protein
MSLRFKATFLLTLLVFGLIYVGIFPFETVQATDAPTRIEANTTWTKTSSPYNLIGNMLVANGVTLTIEPGVTVNLNNNFIYVNGTLKARGSSTEKIQFNSGQIRFTEFSANWSETTSSGSIIENANMDTTSISVTSSSPKISGVSTSEINLSTASPIITNSIINELTGNVYGWSPQILNNQLNKLNIYDGTSTVSHNTVTGDAVIGTTNGVISDNVFSGKLSFTVLNSEISRNTIAGEVWCKLGDSTLSYNNISKGITVTDYNQGIITNNVINGGIHCSMDAITIQNNTITSSDVGISFSQYNQVGGTYASIANNSITAKNIGIQIPKSSVASFMFEYVYCVKISGNKIFNCSTAIEVGDCDAQLSSPRYNIVPITNNFIFNNNIGISSHGDSLIQGNVIINNNCGVEFVRQNNDVKNNIVANNTYGIKAQGNLIEQNFVANNQWGVIGGGIAQNNTIINNIVGARGCTLHFNNIYGNTYNVNASTMNENVTYNWWGTTDSAEISQKIYDYDDDFTLGRVNFTPFLTALNPSAPSPDTPIPEVPQNNPTPTPTTSTSPTTTDQQPSIPEIANPMLTVMATALVASLMLTIRLKKPKTKNTVSFS